MIDINKLRRLALDAAKEIECLRAKVEAAEKSDAESLAMYRKARDERDALRAMLEDERKEHSYTLRAAKAEAKQVDTLRAKIEAMEKQEPVAWARKLGMDLPSPGCVTDLKYRPSDMPESAYMPLYALPGAQPAPSIPDDVMRDAKRYRFLRAAKNIPISTKAARDPIVYDAAIDAAMLAAAPEAKRDAP